MPKSTVFWDPDDEATAIAVASLGGLQSVRAAVHRVLPARNVKVKLLSPGASGAQVFLAYPERNAAGLAVPQLVGVLKFGPGAQLADEARRYQEWVRDVLQSTDNYPILVTPEGINQHRQGLSALFYRRVGEITLGERVQELASEPDAISAVGLLEQLLRVLADWQEISRPETTLSLTSPGVYSFASDPFQALGRLFDSFPDAGFPPVPLETLDVLRRVWTQDGLDPERLLMAAGHGDLHPENVLCDADDHIVLIDFGLTGMGHFLRDVATLEAHLVVRFLGPAGDAKDLASARAYLDTLRPLYDLQAFAPKKDSASLGQPVASALIMRLRSHAWQSLMRQAPNYLPQYVVALLRHFIRLAVRDDSKITIGQRWIACQILSALCDLVEVRNRRLRLRDARALEFTGRSRADGSRAQLDRPFLDERAWSRLATELMAARIVELVGLAPLPLVSALQRELGIRSESLEVQLRYVTRPQAQVYAGATATEDGHRLWQMWTAALTGLRNLVKLMTSKSASGHYDFARTATGLTDGCLIRIVGEQVESVERVVSLHALPRFDQDDATAYGITEMTGVSAELHERLSHVWSRSDSLLIREVDCTADKGTTSATTASFPDLPVLGLSPYGVGPGGDYLRPVALTVIRATGRNGPSVLLKMRSALTDNDDFGKLSLISARILEEDLARSYGATPSLLEDPESALDAIWLQADSPRPFLLPQEAFLRAAQREVFASTRLDLKADRFDLRGSHTLVREDNAAGLGFVVLVVDVSRVELTAARNVNPSTLHEVGIEGLYKSDLPLNRFLSQRRDWLLEHCFEHE